MNTNDLVWQWHLAKEAIKEAQLKEDALRSAVIAAVFGGTLTEGTTSREIADGVTIKAKQTMTRSLDEDALPDVLKMIGTIGEMVVKKSYSLNKKVYDSLLPQDREIMDRAVITKPGKPSLELVMKEAKP